MFFERFIKLSTLFFLVILLTIALFALSTINIIKSQTSTEIQEEIDKQKELLNNTKNEIGGLEEELRKSKEALEGAAEGLPKLEAELRELELQIEINNKNLEKIQIEKDLKEKEQLKLIAEQKESVETSYVLWRFNHNSYANVFKDNSDYYKSKYYSARYFKSGNDFISDLEGRIAGLSSKIDQTSDITNRLAAQTEELKLKKAEIEAQINYHNSVLASSASNLDKLQNQQASIENTINALFVEQQEAAVKEREILNENPNPNPTDPTPNEPPPALEQAFYFSGRGRDLYQGHGVGMSQWGAYGAGLNGMNYEQILKFYYSNISIEARPTNINVIGYGVMDSNNYVAGLSEIPSRACGNSEQANARPDKYVVDNPNTPWDCWPEETIKAQVIAARSYAASYGGPICTSAACQVYEGHQYKRWVADETKDLVIVSKGYSHSNQIIQALYSSDNSQGSGTADNDTIFQNFYGDGTPYSYLRAANDAAFAADGGWANWNYRTGNYDINYLYSMLQFVAHNPASTATGTIKSGVADVLSIGKFTNISFERDPSGRVKKVWFTSESGASKPIGGWWFKSLWNNYMYDIGVYDYMYSQTFYLNSI